MFQLWQVSQEMPLPAFLSTYRSRSFKHRHPAAKSPLKSRALKHLKEIQKEDLLSKAEESKPRITAALEKGLGEALRTLASVVGCRVDEATVADFCGYTTQHAVTADTTALKRDASFDLSSAESVSFRDFITRLSDWRVLPRHRARKTGRHLGVTSKPVGKGQIEATIEETIRTYEGMRRAALSNKEDTQAIDSIIHVCKLQLKQTNRTLASEGPRNDKWLVKCRQGLSDIFEFYAKQLTMIGKAPSFAEIEEANQSWSLSKFLRFLKDFGLSEPSGGRSLSRAEGSDIFMKYAYLRRTMGEQAFFQALELVAQAYFDTVHSAELSDEEKLYRLYDFLECDNPHKYAKKMKGFGRPFASNFRRENPPVDSRSQPSPAKEREDLHKPKKLRRVLPAVVKRVNLDSMKKNILTWKKLEDMSYDQFKDPADHFDIRSLLVETDSEEDLFKLPALKEKRESPLSVQPRQSRDNSYSFRARNRRA
jgi:hypothetical protein